MVGKSVDENKQPFQRRGIVWWIARIWDGVQDLWWVLISPLIYPF
jgi:hypothetical protein